ncbi:MAG: hypothetical protein QM809_03675 [Gordonia sp. (in: high G+C Gram-positive bacteria)]|uniref:hypothetical protein n=1 Tax=Gordonia sp. (in: high G+C Gram-positive bacteria) TaxID=84139 RepID=UPI0039E45647
MTGKISRGLIVLAAAAAVAVTLSACGDSSTASAPLTQDVTTTSVSGSAPTSASAKKSAGASSSAEAAASSQAAAGASKATQTLPATKPEASTSVPGNFPGSQQGRPQMNDKQKAYLEQLKRDDVGFMGDDDKNIALTWGYYVCSEKKKKTDPTMIKVYVRAGIGPTTKNENEAGAKADKLIAAAEKNLC